jgi:Na+-transporting NADH:ubiquinone oxidoreductase subunit NqrC
MSYQNFLEKLKQTDDDDLNFFKKKKSLTKEDKISNVTTVLGLLVFTLYAAYAVSNVNDTIKSVENYQVQKVAMGNKDTKRTDLESKSFTDEDMKLLQKIIDAKEKTNSLATINTKINNVKTASINSEEQLKDSIKSKTTDEQYKQIMGTIKGLSDIEKQLQAEKKSIPALK